MKRKPLIVEVIPSNQQKRHPQFPRVMWADYDPEMPKCDRVAMYGTKADQRMTRPDLKPIKVLVIALEERFDQSVISEAIDVLNRCCEQGHKLS